jgi:hypothetical protein
MTIPIAILLCDIVMYCLLLSYIVDFVQYDTILFDHIVVHCIVLFCIVNLYVQYCYLIVLYCHFKYNIVFRIVNKLFKKLVFSGNHD